MESGITDGDGALSHGDEPDRTGGTGKLFAHSYGGGEVVDGGERCSVASGYQQWKCFPGFERGGGKYAGAGFPPGFDVEHNCVHGDGYWRFQRRWQAGSGDSDCGQQHLDFSRQWRGDVHGEGECRNAQRRMGILVADFNGDGKLDLATGNAAGTAVVVLPGNGDGTFGSGVMTSIAGPPVAVGDFNGDGKPDVLVETGGGPSPGGLLGGTIANVTVLLGNGDGTFTASAASTTGVIESAAITVADFNGDGKLDLAAGGLSLATSNSQIDSGTLTVLLGQRGRHVQGAGDDCLAERPYEVIAAVIQWRWQP